MNIVLVILLILCWLCSFMLLVCTVLSNRYLWAAKLMYKLLFPQDYKDYKEALSLPNIPICNKDSEKPNGYYIYWFNDKHQALFYDTECVLSDGPLLKNLIKKQQLSEVTSK